MADSSEAVLIHKILAMLKTKLPDQDYLALEQNLLFAPPEHRQQFLASLKASVSAEKENTSRGWAWSDLGDLWVTGGILDFLPARDLVRSSAVSRSWLVRSRENCLWRKFAFALCPSYLTLLFPSVISEFRTFCLQCRRRTREQIEQSIQAMIIIWRLHLPMGHPYLLRLSIGSFVGKASGGSQSRQALKFDLSRLRVQDDGFLIPLEPANSLSVFCFGQDRVYSEVTVDAVVPLREEKVLPILHFSQFSPTREVRGKIMFTHSSFDEDASLLLRISPLGRQGVEKLGMILHRDPDTYKINNPTQLYSNRSSLSLLRSMASGDGMSEGATVRMTGSRASQAGELEHGILFLPIAKLFFTTTREFKTNPDAAQGATSAEDQEEWEARVRRLLRAEATI